MRRPLEGAGCSSLSASPAPSAASSIRGIYSRPSTTATATTTRSSGRHSSRRVVRAPRPTVTSTSRSQRSRGCRPSTPSSRTRWRMAVTRVTATSRGRSRHTPSSVSASSSSPPSWLSHAHWAPATRVSASSGPSPRTHRLASSKRAIRDVPYGGPSAVSSAATMTSRSRDSSARSRGTEDVSLTCRLGWRGSPRVAVRGRGAGVRVTNQRAGSRSQ